MAYSAAAMFGGATFLSLIESAIPGGPEFSIAPGIAFLAGVVLLVSFGPRLPYRVLAALGPVGAALIALSLATTDGPGDAAILYIWPVLWAACFFGRLGAALIVIWIGVVHTLALIAMPDGVGSIDRWLDVMVTVGVVSAVVETLSSRNLELLTRLSEEARVDKLTGLLNRRGFEERVATELSHARREGAPVGVVSFDIDHFKRVNDEWGHEAGDRVLSHLGEVFREQSRATDVIARMGGEEFVAVLPLVEVGAARAYAERVRTAFSVPASPDVPRATISAGVTAGVTPVDVEPLLQTADSALYAAKLGGRNRTIVEPSPNGDRALREPGFEPVS
ncbi:MAG TPA: GGDEF domain-containing protein [Solirubrobacterales bacterium]|jgi:diguanylate cyclase (GGDEF)-like protein|nr:GGDEF domain-containing protein [Solirubrobacterales bacterium]